MGGEGERLHRAGGMLDAVTRWLTTANAVRFYAPSEALSNGKYKYPKVETIDAIRG